MQARRRSVPPSTCAQESGWTGGSDVTSSALQVIRRQDEAAARMASLSLNDYLVQYADASLSPSAPSGATADRRTA
jgi:hypothetical protein